MMSSVSFIVMLLIMIIIPTILYSFFFLINCPPFTFIRRHLSANVETNNPATSSKVADEEDDDDRKSKSNNEMELVIASSTSLSFGQQDTECPVCLSAFVQGEELGKLNKCNHLFHKTCIDKWISTHCNCPVCRAFVRNHSKPNKERERERERNRVLGLRNNNRSNNVDDRHDLWQGLPDSAGLV